jgi:hypothetical protein
MFYLGAGFPAHFLSEADDANRATAHEQQMPVNRHVQRMQASFGYFVADMARRAALRSGRFAASPSAASSRSSPSRTWPTTSRSPRRQAHDRLPVAVDRGWVTGEEATRLFFRVFGELLDSPTPTKAKEHETGAF